MSTNNPIAHYDYTLKEFNSENHKKYLDTIFKKGNISIIYDIGANSGATAEIFFNYAKKYNNPLEKIYCFEPDKENFNFLSNHLIQINKNYFEMFNFGIYYGKKKAYASLPKLPDGKVYQTCGGYSISKENLDNGNNYIDIDKLFELKELEELNLPKPNFIKMDIEGSEKNILMNSEIIKNAEYIWLEWRDKEGLSDILKKYLNNFEIILTSADILLQKKN